MNLPNEIFTYPITNQTSDACNAIHHVKNKVILKTDPMTTSSQHRQELLAKFNHKFNEDKFLTRQLVSFQANKNQPQYRWFRYKEGFSANLIQYYIEKFNLQEKRFLDPFAGSGTSLFVASKYGCKATGIELLPVGAFVIKYKNTLDEINTTELKKMNGTLWDNIEKINPYKNYIKHIPITDGAFPQKTEVLLNKYLTYITTLPPNLYSVLKFAAFTVLEDISYTRKDGQCLRWDYRANRQLKQKFNKGIIADFKTAIDLKLKEIIEDLSHGPEDSLFSLGKSYRKGKVKILESSCLYKLPQIKANSFDFIITSPPYANRYDYTRTYALELVYLGKSNEDIKTLRQQLLSATVENKSKINQLQTFYENIGKLCDFEKVLSVFKKNQALNEILNLLEKYKMDKTLNNNGVVKLVRNYFLEMCFIIFEMARVLDKKGTIIMVNDNVKYAGEEIPVDLILSDFAEQFGLTIKNIFVLSQQKGNSSQQMGKHGRTPLRKGVYLWQKN